MRSRSEKTGGKVVNGRRFGGLETRFPGLLTLVMRPAGRPKP